MQILNPFLELDEHGNVITRRPPPRDFLTELRIRRQRYRTHVAAWALFSFALFSFGILIDFEPRPGLVMGLFWGILVGVHTVRHRGWLADHRAEILAAGSRVSTALLEEAPDDTTSAADTLDLETGGRRQPGRLERAVRLELAARFAPDTHANPGPARASGGARGAGATAHAGAPAEDPLLRRCEEAAVKTRERLDGLGPGEIEALAVVDEGLERVRELLDRKKDIAAAIAEAAPQSVGDERKRLEARIQDTIDAEARALYASQLELLDARAEKITALRGLEERTVAYAESYLAALTSLRMDALRLKSADLSPNFEPAQLLNPVRQLERQVEGMRSAAREVARVVQQAP